MTDPDFWRKRWEDGATGWHLSDVHPSLIKYWGDICTDTGGAVFVPLCGKSLDMIWLAEEGHHVFGVELSQLALRSFFEDNKLPFETETGKRFTTFKSEQFTLFQGNYFDLTNYDLAGVKTVYDRAALIALPPDMQNAYVARQKQIFAPGTNILLFTFSYDQAMMEGPPFSVPASCVQRLYQDWCEVEHLSTSAPTDFRGTLAHENAFHLRVK